MDRIDWEVELEKRKLLQEKLISERKKNMFIDEIKNGLGEKILKEPNKVHKKPSLLSRFKKILGWN